MLREMKQTDSNSVVSLREQIKEPTMITGYPNEIFLEPVPDNYHCARCQNVMKNPVKFEICGHFACSLCFTQLMKNAVKNSNWFFT
ncbi:hypothetical protein Ciccas_007989 [Cichlidogyrus casuarinus]|uniref:Zinc finger C3HC4 RING-type domain-containing protein n=1 Tax=Cichlidogyrus casuarinus TaxID=1844966 RepID=A0ABD2Q194_9PLAT